MTKRIVAVLLAVVMILALVGCGKQKREPIQLTLSTEDAEAILAAAGIMLPDAETAAGANSVVKYFCWHDYLQNYSEDEIINTGYFTFQQKYGGSVQWIETTYADKNNDLANLVLAGTSPDCGVTGTSNFACFPMDCINNMYQPIDKWIDYTNPLWADMASASEYFSLGDKHFAIVTDLTYKDVITYNRRVMDEWGFDDPAELYANDEWTWDVYYEMCMDFSDGDENRYALDGWYVVNSLVEESSGITLIAKDENGKFYSNLDNPIIEVAENMIYDLVKNDCCYHEGSNWWANRNEAVYGSGIKDGKCLFYPCDRDDGFRLPVEEMNNIWGDIENGEFMFCPLPRYQNGDGKYYLNAMPKGYMMIQGAENPDGVALLAACERFKILDPTVVNIDEKQLKETYKWTEEMLEMNRTCNAIVAAEPIMFYTGNLPQKMQDIYNTFDWNIRRSGASQTWAQLKESNRESFEYYLEELNALISEYQETGEVTAD